MIEDTQSKGSTAKIFDEKMISEMKQEVVVGNNPIHYRKFFGDDKSSWEINGGTDKV
jgi:hypothetical protein